LPKGCCATFIRPQALVMLVWGVASEALRDIVTKFLNEVLFD
jgi:hypothetical protein